MLYDFNPLCNELSRVKSRILMPYPGAVHKTFTRDNVVFMGNYEYTAICFDAARNLCKCLNFRQFYSNHQDDLIHLIARTFLHIPPNFMTEPMNYIDEQHQMKERFSGDFRLAWRDIVELDKALITLPLYGCDYEAMHNASEKAFRSFEAAYVLSGLSTQDDTSEYSFFF